MDGWLIALITLAIIIIVVLILLAIYASPTSDAKNNVSETQLRNSSNEHKQHSANLTISFINLSNQTSNFLQQVKCGYKGVRETFDDMNNLVNYICHCFHMIGVDNTSELKRLLCEKNDLYKDLTEEVLVNKKIIKASNRFLKELNEKNLKIADIFVTTCNKNAKQDYITFLHKYDVTVVSQMGALVENNYKLYIESSRQAQKISLTTAMVLTYCAKNK